MKKSDAWKHAAQWVEENAAPVPGYSGSFIVGSIAHLAPDQSVPAGSDVDIIVILEDNAPRPSPGQARFLYSGVLLETSYCPLRVDAKIIPHF